MMMFTIHSKSRKSDFHKYKLFREVTHHHQRTEPMQLQGGNQSVMILSLQEELTSLAPTATNIINCPSFRIVWSTLCDDFVFLGANGSHSSF